MCVSNKEVLKGANVALVNKLKKSEQKNKALLAERSELRAALRAERKKISVYLKAEIIGKIRLLGVEEKLKS